ncbi:peptidase [Sphingomonas piscis]|uniref:Peptidase n=1 Tax=Sphingomonas piscis TaxID=2714943 RepID=A0A6G7YLU5_9SPHN|nr:prepilin peptidase [Sphingomonas piscis]QIK77714.1 peptidase [Sphingomonas piscis]
MINVGFTDILLGALAVLMLTAAVTDLRRRKIPNWLVLTIGVMAPLFWWSLQLPIYPDVALRAGTGLLVFLALFGLFCVGGMGGGDVKLATAIALWFPPQVTLLFLLVMSLAGAVVSTAAWVHHSKIMRRQGRTVVPYGVAIAFAGLLILAQRYLNQFA